MTLVRYTSGSYTVTHLSVGSAV
uniref:Uncharacterized protein n=1 Tax=Anguilla anguilla TaxID=7936 RepID=A0A0E9SYY4_ANGAN